MDNTTNETNGEKKPEQTVFDVNLHEDYTGRRVYTDKRFPNGRVRIYIPAPDLEVDEETNKFFMDILNCKAQDLLDAGIVQRAYGERDWDNLKYGSKKASECTDEEVLTNIAKGLADINSEDFEEKAREFFELAIFIEKRERTSDTTKVVAKKLKNAGLTDISDDEIAAIIEARKAAQEEAAE